MLCPDCGRNQRRRSGLVCAHCRYRFALDPKVAPFCADRRFLRGIAEAGADGTRAYTPSQLHAVIFRRRNRGFWRRIVLARGTSEVAATKGAVGTWRRAGRDPGPIVERPTLSRDGSPPIWPEPDLFDYGAEGILAVDDPMLVDLLVLNQVHSTAKVAILEGNSGYPQPTAARLASLVAARQDLPIFLLHCSAGGKQSELEREVRLLLGAAANPVIDLGLPVDVARRIPAMRWARHLPLVTADMLPHRWLTAGVAAAIAHRRSLVGLLEAPPDTTGAESDSSWWVLWGDSDDDFG